MRSKPILVTGATGYVGGRLAPKLLGGGLRVRFWLPAPPPGEFGQGKDGGTRADFLMPAASGVSTFRSRPRGLAVLIL
jgi:nucleoside-diphosphate-sugar epimerase